MTERTEARAAVRGRGKKEGAEEEGKEGAEEEGNRYGRASGSRGAEGADPAG